MKEIMDLVESSEYLISMTPIEEILRIGRALNLCSNSRVLDLCCGYGEMLRIFAENFGCHGTGVDGWEEFVTAGRKRIEESGLANRVSLVKQDARTWNEKEYDVACLVGEQNTFGGFEGTLRHLLTKIKPEGSVVIGTPYYYQQEVPKELIEYEGELETETEIFSIVKDNKCIVTCTGRGTTAEWDRYISWSARRGLANYRKETDPVKKEDILQGLHRWHDMYLNYRMKYQGWAMYAIEQI